MLRFWRCSLVESPFVSAADTPAILDDSRGMQAVALELSGVAGAGGCRHHARHLGGRQDKTTARETSRLSQVESRVVRKFKVECRLSPATPPLELSPTAPCR